MSLHDVPTDELWKELTSRGQRFANEAHEASAYRWFGGEKFVCGKCGETATRGYGSDCHNLCKNCRGY